MIGPAPILALLVGIFHTSLFVLIRGSAGGQLPLLLLAAVLGAWAGDALGGRLGFDLLRIGDSGSGAHLWRHGLGSPSGRSCRFYQRHGGRPAPETPQQSVR